MQPEDPRYPQYSRIYTKFYDAYGAAEERTGEFEDSLAEAFDAVFDDIVALPTPSEATLRDFYEKVFLAAIEGFAGRDGYWPNDVPLEAHKLARQAVRQHGVMMAELNAEIAKIVEDKS